MRDKGVMKLTRDLIPVFKTWRGINPNTMNESTRQMVSWRHSNRNVDLIPSYRSTSAIGALVHRIPTSKTNRNTFPKNSECTLIHLFPMILFRQDTTALWIIIKAYYSHILHSMYSVLCIRPTFITSLVTS